MRTEGRRLEVVIPVRHIWWVRLLERFYARRGIAPLWIVDATSHPVFRALVAGGVRRRVVVRPTAPRAETMLAPAVERLSSEWVMRMDGDELPSAGLVDLWRRIEAGEAPETEGADVLACRRHWLRVEGGRAERSENSLFGREGQDHQYRLFRRGAVPFTEAIHTPGIEAGAGRLAFAGPEAAIWHLNWACYTEAERRAKIAAYDAQSPGAGSNFRAFYLPEEAVPGTHLWHPVEEAPVAKAALRVHKARHRPLGRLLARIGPN